MCLSKAGKNLLKQNGVNAKYVRGNLCALKNEVSKGNPVIVLIRVEAKKPYLHFVPVVGGIFGKIGKLQK